MGEQKSTPGADLRAEVDYVRSRAALRDSRVVTIGDWLLFSSESGDAWLLDTSDQFATMIAKDGEPVSIDVDTSANKITIAWTGRYRIDGMVFIYIELKTGHITPIKGYPTQQIMKKTKVDVLALMPEERETLDLLRRLRKQ
jgi:hypothetical protein